MKWTLGLTAAGGCGSLMGGGKEILALAVIAGSVLLILEVWMWTYAKSFGERDDSPEQ